MGGLEPPGISGEVAQDRRLIRELAQHRGERDLQFVAVGEEPVGELGTEVAERLLSRVSRSSLNATTYTHWIYAPHTRRRRTR